MLTSRSADLAAGVALSGASETSPGKNIGLHRTTAGFTPPKPWSRASRSLARSPCSAPPHIQFLSVGLRFRSTRPSRRPRGPTLCASLRFARCDQLTRGLPPPRRCPCRAHKKNPGGQAAGADVDSDFRDVPTTAGRDASGSGRRGRPGPRYAADQSAAPRWPAHCS